MVRVAYGICSEGMGHATRSISVINLLIKLGHEVHIFTAGRVFDYLNSKYDNVYKIKGFNLTYKQGSLDNFHTTTQIFKSLPNVSIPTFFFLKKHFKSFKPNVIISDHEAFTSLYGKLFRIPVIGVSNMSIITKMTSPKGLKTKLFVKSLTKIVERMSNFYATKYIIPTYFYPEIKSRKVQLVDITVREKIMKLKAVKKNHILVYHTTKTFTSLLDAIKKVKNEKFIVYGFGKKRNTKNVIFKEFDDSFMQDLATCKAVITGGGFSTISEAIYLKKPVLCAFTKDHYEQIINAHYLWSEKYGEFTENISQTVINDFLLKLSLYQYYLEKRNWNPDQYKHTIVKTVKALTNSKKIS